MEDITLTQSQGGLVPKLGVKKGLWRPEEDLLLIKYVEAHGEGNWATVSQRSGLMRGGKSCRLRWKNYLRPDIKRGDMSKDEEDLIIRMHKLLGNRWSLIAGRLPGRTDNEVKNYWNTHLNKGAGSRGKRKIPGGDDNVNGRSKRRRRGFSYSQAGGADKSSSTSSEGGFDIGRKELIEEYSRNYIPMMEEDTKSFFTHDMEMESSMLPSVEDTTAFFCYAEPFSYPFSLFETLGEMEW